MKLGETLQFDAELFLGKLQVRAMVIALVPIPPPYDGSNKRPRYWKKARQV